MKKNEIRLMIKGDPKTKKNNPRIVGGKYPKLLPSKISVKYEREGIKQIKDQIDDDFKTIDYPVNIKTVFYREQKRRVDISNLISAVHDILERSGVIEGDDWSIVESVDGSKIRFDKEDPRTEIIITPVKNSAYHIVKEEEERERILKKKRREEKERIRKEKAIKCYELRYEAKDDYTFREIGDIVGVSASTASKYSKEIKEERREQ